MLQITDLLKLDTPPFSRPDDWIPHRGVSRTLFKQCVREGRPPNGHVIIRFLDPYAGCTLIKESVLILKDRGLVVGDVVKKSASDVESGYVTKVATQLTLQPIYTELPYAHTESWPYKAEESEVRVPAEEVAFIDYQVGDYVLYRDWVGEVSDVYEEVTIRLSNGSVVRVKESLDLEVAEFRDLEYDESPYKRKLVPFLKTARESLSAATGKGDTGPADMFFPGQVVFTKKSNIRLGHWVIGSYSPSIAPRGIVLEARVIRLEVDWIMCDTFSAERESMNMPPSMLTTDELDRVRLYNKNNVSNTPEGSAHHGSRQGHDIGVGDHVKFRDISGAAVKYSELSPTAATNGTFHRIPRTSTMGFDMNVMYVKETSQTVEIQWQDGSATALSATEVIPYLNVDEHDLWVGEICSLKLLETEANGSIKLGKIGVVQSVNAPERTASIRWYEGSDISVYQHRHSTMESGGKLGTLTNETSQVSVYEVLAYPALTKRRGDLVLIAPEGDGRYTSAGTDGIMAMRNGWTAGIADGIQASTHRPKPTGEAKFEWFGEVVDLGRDGLLTVRLGALNEVRDIKVEVTRVTVLVGGDDDEDIASAAGSFLDDADSDSYDSDSDLDEVIIEETITYEGGARLDDGDEEGWTDEDIDSDDEEDDEMEDEPPEDANPASIPAQDIDMPDAANTAVSKKKSIHPTLPSLPSNHKEYDFSTYPNMPSQFDILDTEPPPSHHYLSASTTLSAPLLRRIRKEHTILSTSLPAGIWVRTWASRLDLLRILIIGPRGTPYELAPFMLDFWFKDDFPHSPPQVFFHSWTYGVGRINPNLYEDGKVCLSVLGTWPGDEKGEGWDKEKSSVLQVIVSLLGLVLVEKPYYSKSSQGACIASFLGALFISFTPSPINKIIPY